MSNKTIVTGILMDEDTVISFVEVCQTCHISQEQLLDMLEYGLCQAHSKKRDTLHFNTKTVARIQAATRLQRDLDINLPGIALALDLLDELEDLRNEIRVLQRNF